MGLFESLGLTNKGGTKGARDTLAGYMQTLAGADCLGVPPLSVYERFNSAGSDFHGQCAVAQGASGYRLGADAKLDVAKMIPASASVGLTAAATLKLSAARLPTSAIMIFRLPSAMTAVGVAQMPIALAQLDGINWTLKAAAGAGIGAGHDFEKIAAAKISADASLSYTWLNTRLVSFGTQHFTGTRRQDIANAVDAILALELKKTLANILTYNEAEERKLAKAAGWEVGSKSMKDIAKAKQDDLTAIGKKTLSDLRRGVGYEYALAGFAFATPLVFAGKVIYDAFMARKDMKLDEQMLDLREKLSAEVRRLTAAGKSAKDPEVLTLRTATDRISDLRNAFLEERVYKTSSVREAGALPKVDKAHLERTDETALALTSREYGAEIGVKGEFKVFTKMQTSAKAGADVMGQKIDFRFQVRGANDMLMVQDTQVDYLQMTAEAAVECKFGLTGVKAVDDKLNKEVANEVNQKKAGNVKQVLAKRRFGALIYRAATVYLEGGSARTKRPKPGVSGLSMGVSVRSARLISYANQVRELIRTNAPDAQTKAFESWVCLHLGCQPPALRDFLKDSLLADAKVGEDGKTAFPSDALILEASYGMKAAALPAMTMGSDGAPISLFDYMSYGGMQGFQNDVSKDKYTLSALRLRYRIQSPLKSTPKTYFSLGLPLKQALPLSVNIDFGANKEVGQESIVDLAAQFSSEIRGLAASEFEKYEMSVPPVVLFNRC
ncbi:hypothetical protein [Primorskyibacter sp. 2E233]|uniref:hypothetical protein n=1 Tax=Primorskyibacter sp. 2E233 TaxID=3413431 RepID=UPI003BF05E5C